jgi:hypothetical protein
MGRRIAVPSCGRFDAFEPLRELGGEVHGFDCDIGKAAIASDLQRLPFTICDVEAQRFVGFDVVVALGALDRMRAPWDWIARFDSRVQTLVIGMTTTGWVADGNRIIDESIARLKGMQWSVSDTSADVKDGWWMALATREGKSG